MRIKTERYTTLLCIIGIISVAFGLSIAISANDDYDTGIVIYHTNDMHGNVDSIWEDGVLKRVGLDVIKSVKSGTPNSILVDAGDAIWGTEFAKYNKGLDVINLMNLAGYDVMTLGNHEFDYGLNALLECVKSAKFPVISANVYKDRELFLKNINGSNGCNHIIDIAGKRIGFFGITTEETNRITIPPNLEGITFENEIETAKKEVEKLKRQNVDIIVAITHLGVDASSKITSRDIAKKVQGIDIIIDGHSHTEIIDKENNTIISQTGVGSSNLGKIEIKFTKDNHEIKPSVMASYDIGRIYKPDSNITKTYDDIYSNISPLIKKVIGKIENNLYGGTYNGVNISRLAETSLGDFICDAMLIRGKEMVKDTEFMNYPLVAFENGGAVRSKIDVGYIKMDNVYSIFPLDNKLSLQIITPKTLYQVLERGVGKLTLPKSESDPFTAPFGGFPQISGMRIEVDPSLEGYDYDKNTSGKRVTSVTLVNDNDDLNMPLSRDDDETKIAFLFNDHALYEYPALNDIEILKKDDYLYNIVSDYISDLTYDNGGKFSYLGAKNRIIIKNKFSKNSKYNSEIILKDSTGTLNMVSVNVAIDNNNVGLFISDENAKIILKDLDFGAHIIKIKYGDIEREIYINNEVGIKDSSVDFTDKSYEDIESISDLIGQIPYNVTLEDENVVKFARVSYESLNHDQKSKILNYGKLASAEDSIKTLKGETSTIGLVNSLNDNKALMVISIIVFISGAVIIWRFNKKIKN